MSTAKAELKALSGVSSSALFGCSAGTRDRGTIDLKKRDRTRTLVALGGSGRPSRCARPPREPLSEGGGPTPNTRSSWGQRQASAMLAAHAIASSREGSSSTVKPPLSGGAHEYPPAENVPSAETSTGGAAPAIPAREAN